MGQGMQKQQQQEFEEFWGQNERHLRSFAYYKTGNSEDAEDLLANARLRVLASLGRGNVIGNFKACMKTAIVNLYKDDLRAKGRHPAIDFTDIDASPDDNFIDKTRSTSPGPEDVIMGQGLTDVLENSILFLPAGLRKAVEVALIAYDEDQSTTDIVKQTGINHSAHKTNLRRARRILKWRANEQGYEIHWSPKQERLAP